MKISDIKPYDRNAKQHPKRHIEQIAASIKEFGFNQPIVLDKNNVIIVGHGRYEAAKILGLTEVPTITVDLTEEQAKAYRLADNQLNALTGFDMDLVVEELKGLSDEMFDLTGFDRDLLIEPDAKDDEVPPIPDAPRSVIGDVYQLGPHRVLCGDSTQIEAVERLMDGKKADMSFTSPPYNVGHNLGYEGKESKYENSTDDLDDYVNLIVQSTRNAMKYSAEVFVNIQFLANNKKDVILWLADLADRFKDIFFWKKLQVAPQMADNVANNQVEIIVLFGHNNNRKWGNKRFHGNFSTYIETKSASGENKNAKIHNATFPVELPLKFITHGYNDGSIILDLFIGTGSTLIAAEKTGRICYGMELDPKYIDVVVQRYIDYTGNTTIIKNGQEEVWTKTPQKTPV